MSKINEAHDATPIGVVDRNTTVPPDDGSDVQSAARDMLAKPAVREVQVHCDYISADGPIHRKFDTDTTLAIVKDWARSMFVPNPPSDKAYYLNDDKTRHRFTEQEEQQSLAQLGYEHGAVHLRLNEEQASGACALSSV